jgi:hypothetical protein
MNASVQIFDLTGRCVYTFFPAANTDRLLISTSDLSSGMYIVNIKADNTNTNIEVVVQ